MSNPTSSTTNNNTDGSSPIQSQIDQAVNQIDQGDTTKNNKTRSRTSPKTTLKPPNYNQGQQEVENNQSVPSYFDHKTSSPPSTQNISPTLTDQELQHIQEKPEITSKVNSSQTRLSQLVLYGSIFILGISIIGGIIFLATLIL